MRPEVSSQPKYIPLYKDVADALTELDAADLKACVIALRDYVWGDGMAEISGPAKAVFVLSRGAIDATLARARRNRANGRKHTGSSASSKAIRTKATPVQQTTQPNLTPVQQTNEHDPTAIQQTTQQNLTDNRQTSHKEPTGIQQTSHKQPTNSQKSTPRVPNEATPTATAPKASYAQAQPTDAQNRSHANPTGVPTHTHPTTDKHPTNNPERTEGPSQQRPTPHPKRPIRQIANRGQLDDQPNTPSKSVGAPPPRTPKGRFVVPSVDEVRTYAAAYCERKGLPIGVFDAERFCDYYESVGWRRGKQPMKSWQAAARSWIAKDAPKGGDGDGVRQKDIFDAYD